MTTETATAYRALTVRWPYTDAIVTPSPMPKRIENRSWPLPARYVGVPVLLHSAATPERKPVLPGPWEIVHLHGDRPGLLGVILALVTFTASHLDGDGCDEACAQWGFPDVFHWDIADVIALPVPVPAKGQQQFWTPGDAVQAAVREQLAEVA